MTNHTDPAACHVCGRPEADHVRTPDQVTPWAKITGHVYWSNADALAEATAHDARTSVRYSTGATSPEALYVDETRGR